MTSTCGKSRCADTCGVDHAQCWEHDMAKSTHSRTLLASAAAAALAGTALAALLAGNIATLADAGSAAADTQLSLANPDVPLCGALGAGGRPNMMMLRLAQTEVPRAEMSVATYEPDFANTIPPQWKRIRCINYTLTIDSH